MFITQAPLHLFGDDVSRHNGLTVQVLGFTYVGSKVYGLHVFHGHDALGEPRSATHAPVHQPPGSVGVNRPLVLCQRRHGLLYWSSKRSNL